MKDLNYCFQHFTMRFAVLLMFLVGLVAVRAAVIGGSDSGGTSATDTAQGEGKTQAQ